MKRYKVKKALALTMGTAMSITAFSGLAGCGKKADALILMSDELNGLFSPYYSTAGSDMEIMGQTQIGMFTTNENGEMAVGENEACVALDYELKKVDQGGGVTYSDYYFVIKNGLKFSDGTPLTMNDVMFNLYEFLDPTYVGSSTMYSTDIVGLKDYRTQTRSSGDSSAEDELSKKADGYAKTRRDELITAFHEIGRRETENSYFANAETMRSELANSNSSLYTPASGLPAAIGVTTEAEARAQLVEDYNHVVGDPNGSDESTKKGLFREELENDFKGAKDAYKEAPYKDAPVVYQGSSQGTGLDDVMSFMFAEGYAKVEYNQTQGGTPDRSKIKEISLLYNPNEINTQEKAIQKVYEDMVNSKFDQIISFYASGTTLYNEFIAKAKEVALNENRQEGKLAVPNISGITSLGHTGDKDTEIINNTEYKIAKQHNADGTPANEGEYDVLRIRVNGIDPKAIWNFAFTVAPYNYYSDPETYPIDIANDQFGVGFATFDFQMKVIQGKNKQGDPKNNVPVGAGTYMATDRSDSDLPSSEHFIESNIVYYKANPYFMFPVKTEHLRYQVVPSINALTTLKTGDVHFVTPQFTTENYREVNDKKNFEDKGFRSLSAWQLGYGYIGINAGKVTDINLRRAIMAAMETVHATTYYSSGSAVRIEWPMSAVSWAYPREDGYGYNGADPTAHMKPQTDPNLSYAATNGVNLEARKAMIREYMNKAGVQAGDSRLRVKFTIAGADLTEHPCYNTMLQAKTILEECGWDIQLTPDPNALIKLSTGSLEVWAAAWGSSLDPDMYQIYHKNSTATSVLAWGYREILAAGNARAEENAIINELSNLIDQARRVDSREERTPIYEQAMKKVIELAVELPVYQRKTLYAYNANVIDEDTLTKDENGRPLINSYSSPLNRLWEVGLVK